MSLTNDRLEELATLDPRAAFPGTTADGVRFSVPAEDLADLCDLVNETLKSRKGPRVAKVWWYRGPAGLDEPRWRVYFDDTGETVDAKHVDFAKGGTDIRHEGFTQLDGGPRGILIGLVTGYEPWG